MLSNSESYEKEAKKHFLFHTVKMVGINIFKKECWQKENIKLWSTWCYNIAAENVQNISPHVKKYRYVFVW